MGGSSAFQAPALTAGKTNRMAVAGGMSNSALMAATMDGTAVNGQVANGTRRKKTKKVSYT